MEEYSLPDKLQQQDVVVEKRKQIFNNEEKGAHCQIEALTPANN
jgi:hypothetical protein